jgi:ABC-2 type transport system ATP-binding protein
LSEAVLEAELLTKRYRKRIAVNGLSFAVRPGEIYGFLGRNGAGKSTTLRMILGLVWPTSGTIRVAGQVVRPGRPRATWPVGAIVESPVFYDYLPARKNLELLASLSGGASRARIDAVLELVRLSTRANDLVGEYSHGMRQRLGLAQALLPEPRLVILDEPLDGLDPKGIRELREVMLDIVRTSGVTIMYSSHILSEVELTCDRVLVIHEGNRLYEGPTRDLVATGSRVRVRLGGGGDATEVLERLDYVRDVGRADSTWTMDIEAERVPELNRALVSAGLDVLELAPARRTLEDVFLSLTSGASDNGGGKRT